jgi:hypothetical protein
MKREIILALMIAFSRVSGGLSQMDDPSSRKTLQGLTAMGVHVEQLPPAAKDDGLTESDLRTKVELKLRLAGIRVVDPEEASKLPGMPYLHLLLTTIDTDYGFHSSSVELDLNQTVILARKPAMMAIAATWRRSVVVTAGKSYSAKGLGDAVDQLCDMFLNAYLSVNPKKQT